MKSPFPGMDPFIEARGLWSDFRTQLIVGLERVLNTTIPEQFAARLGHRCYMDQPLNDEEPDNEGVTWSADDFVPRPPAVANPAEDGSFVMHAGPPERLCREAYIHIYKFERAREEHRPRDVHRVSVTRKQKTRPDGMVALPGKARPHPRRRRTLCRN
jgi:hypothetical protein